MAEGKDRGATETRIVEAAARMMLEEGAGSLGVNALAKAADCDKQLIYRYFGGLDGVLAALGEGLAERLKADLPVARAADWPSFSRALAGALLAAYRAEPLLGRMRAAEFAGPPGGMASFVAARGRVLAGFVQASRPEVPPPPGVDIPALHALLVGAIEATVLSAAASGAMVGMTMDDAGWARAGAMLDRLVAGAYGAGDAVRPVR